MKAIIVDAAGAILRSVSGPTTASLLAQAPSGCTAWAVPPLFGLVDDSKLVLAGGVLTAKAGVGGDVQHAGETLTQITAAA